MKNKNQRGFSAIIVAVIVAVVVLGGGILAWQKGWISKERVQLPKDEALKPIMVRQAGGQAMLIAECGDKNYITNLADYIIEGTIEKVESKLEEVADGKVIFTYTDFIIEKYIKGTPFKTNKLQIKTDGGTVGEIAQWVEDQPIFQQGKKVRIYFKKETNEEFWIICGGFGVEEIGAVQDETADLSSKASATADWVTHKNEELGIEFKYPNSGKIRLLGAEDMVIFPVAPIDHLLEIDDNLVGKNIITLGITDYSSVLSPNKENAPPPYLSKEYWKLEEGMVNAGTNLDCSNIVYLNNRRGFCEIYTNPNGMKFIAAYWYNQFWASSTVSYITHHKNQRIEFLIARTPILDDGTHCWPGEASNLVNSEELLQKCNQGMKNREGIDNKSIQILEVFDKIVSTFKFLE